MVSKVTLEYIVINSPEGKMLITPVGDFGLAMMKMKEIFYAIKYLQLMPLQVN